MTSSIYERDLLHSLSLLNLFHIFLCHALETNVMFNQRPLSELGVVRAHCCDSGNGAGEFPVQDQSGLHSKTLFLKSQSWGEAGEFVDKW